MKLEALIFDVDGTLVDTEELHRQAYNQTFLDFGFGWDWDADRYAELLSVSGGQARLARYIDLIDLPPAEKMRLRRLIPAIHKEKSKLYGELVASNAVPLAAGCGAADERGSGAGMRVGLVASSASSNVDTVGLRGVRRELRKAVGAIVMRRHGRTEEARAGYL